MLLLRQEEKKQQNYIIFLYYDNGTRIRCIEQVYVTLTSIPT